MNDKKVLEEMNVDEVEDDLDEVIDDLFEEP